MSSVFGDKMEETEEFAELWGSLWSQHDLLGGDSERTGSGALGEDVNYRGNFGVLVSGAVTKLVCEKEKTRRS